MYDGFDCGLVLGSTAAGKPSADVAHAARDVDEFDMLAQSRNTVTATVPADAIAAVPSAANTPKKGAVST